MKQLSPLLVVLSLILVSSCATTPVRNQLLTLDTFNNIYEQYLNAYDQQMPEVKAKWKAEIDPYWLDASVAIDAYVAFTDPTTPDAQKKLALYKAAKDQAVKLLFKYGIEIKEK